jgi:predicted transcriptional regulator
MKKKYCFVIESEEIGRVDMLAKQMERSRSFAVRDAIKNYLKAKSKTQKRSENGTKERL